MTSIYCNINSYTLEHKIYLIDYDVAMQEIGSSVTADLDEKLLFLSQRYNVDNIKLQGIGANILAEQIYSLNNVKYNNNNLIVEVI
jgi:hypothetical protein